LTLGTLKSSSSEVAASDYNEQVKKWEECDFFCEQTKHVDSFSMISMTFRDEEATVNRLVLLMIF
jgi:hypothetical protein